MENLIEAIRGAVADGATDDAKQAGASACRAILAALDGEAGKSLVPMPANSNVFAALGKMDLNQILDVAIARLRVLNAAKPGGTEAPSTPTRGVSFQLLPVPRGGARSGGD